MMEKGIKDLEAYIGKEFEIKDLEELKYSLELELQGLIKDLLSSIHWTYLKKQ